MFKIVVQRTPSSYRDGRAREDTCDVVWCTYVVNLLKNSNKNRHRQQPCH